jgi:hypothetical protein
MQRDEQEAIYHEAESPRYRLSLPAEAVEKANPLDHFIHAFCLH